MAKDVWREALRPTDERAKFEPVKLKLKAESELTRPPKPFRQKRSVVAETWLEEHMKKLEHAGVVRLARLDEKVMVHPVLTVPKPVA